MDFCLLFYLKLPIASKIMYSMSNDWHNASAIRTKLVLFSAAGRLIFLIAINRENPTINRRLIDN